MNRIENIIDDCNNCRWMQKYLSVASNTDFAYVCMKTENVLMLTSSNGTSRLEIPDFCLLLKTELPKTDEL